MYNKIVFCPMYTGHSWFCWQVKKRGAILLVSYINLSLRDT